jgi:hypothetical protein
MEEPESDEDEDDEVEEEEEAEEEEKKETEAETAPAAKVDEADEYVSSLFPFLSNFQLTCFTSEQVEQTHGRGLDKEGIVSRCASYIYNHSIDTAAWIPESVV